VDVDTLLYGLSAEAATLQVIPCIGSVSVFSEFNDRDTGNVVFSVRSDLPLDLWSLATAGTQESDSSEYKHLQCRERYSAVLKQDGVE
jgi:hypothetical protein